MKLLFHFVHIFSAVTEITIKTGSDGTDSSAGIKICDGAGEAKRNSLTNYSSLMCMEQCAEIS